LVLDLDDGVGPFSKVSLENGLKFNLLVVRNDLIPNDFDNAINSKEGLIFFNGDTGRYLS